MSPYVVVPIVEGYGEVHAVPMLIKRWLKHRNFQARIQVDVKGPIRASGSGALKVAHDEDGALGIEYYVKIALLRRPHVILVIVDGDEECPRDLGQTLLARARAIVPPDYPIGVVVAQREYEAWFLAALASRRFVDGLLAEGFDLPNPEASRTQVDDVESIADCKGVLADRLGLTRYEPTIHQLQLTRLMPFSPGMSRRSRSFRKLVTELDSLMKQARRRGV